MAKCEEILLANDASVIDEIDEIFKSWSDHGLTFRTELQQAQRIFFNFMKKRNADGKRRGKGRHKANSKGKR